MTQAAMETPVLSSLEVCDLVGCTYRQLDYWARQGLVCPSVGRSRHVKHVPGRGWTCGDVRVLRVVQQLRELSNGHAGHGNQRGARLAVDWNLLGRLVRGHHRAGWLVITSSAPGRTDLGITSRPETVLEWQTSASASICVRIEAL